MIEILHEVSGKRVEFTLSDGGELGKCVCSSEADYFAVEELDCPPPFYEGMVRAALNYAAQNGLDRALFGLSEEHISALKSRGFPITGRQIESIAAFFAVKRCAQTSV